jgi:hypothetical protein
MLRGKSWVFGALPSVSPWIHIRERTLERGVQGGTLIVPAGAIHQSPRRCLAGRARGLWVRCGALQVGISPVQQSNGSSLQLKQNETWPPYLGHSEVHHCMCPYTGLPIPVLGCKLFNDIIWFFTFWVLHLVAYLSNWFFMTPSIATKFQYINSV